MKYIIANWKANKTRLEVDAWIREFRNQLDVEDIADAIENKILTFIICPPFPFLYQVADVFYDVPGVHTGTQTISPSEQGAHTGEVTASMVEGDVQYAIIGHSERRSTWSETDELTRQQVLNARAKNITPILCIRNEHDQIHEGVSMVAFEPVEAIGTGMNMPADQVLERKNQFALPHDALFIYGGSVKAESAKEYLSKEGIDGLLIGSASLDPVHFVEIGRSAL